MPAWSLTIGGVDYSSYCVWDSVTINQTARHRGSTMSVELAMYSKAMNRPKAFQTITFRSITQNANLFGGIILKSVQTEIGAGMFQYRISCIDYTKWLDHMITDVTAYPAPGQSGRADQVAVQVLQRYVTSTTGDFHYIGLDKPPACPIDVTTYSAATPGGRVYPSTYTLTAIEVNLEQVSGVIDQIAKVSDAMWFIDADRKFWFADSDVARSVATGLLAPLSQTSVTIYDETYQANNTVGGTNRGTVTMNLPTLDADNPYANVPAGYGPNQTSYRSLKLTEDASQTISDVFIYGFEQASDAMTYESLRTGPYPKAATVTNGRLRGDASTRFFPLTQKPASAATTTVYLRDFETAAGNGTTPFKTYTAAAGNLKTEYIDGQPSDATITLGSGRAVAGSTSTTLATGLTATLNAWAGKTVYLTGGMGAGQQRSITGNTVGTSPMYAVATVASPVWAVTPDATTTFAIFPPGSDWVFVCTSNQGIRFTVAPAATHDIDVWYHHLFPGANMGLNASLAKEIASREGFGGGYYTISESNSAYTTPMLPSEGLTPWMAAVDITLRRQARFKYFATFESTLAGWRPGQQFAITSILRGDLTNSSTGYATWETTFTQRFYVTQVEQVPYGSEGILLSSVEASSDFWGA